MYRDTDQSYRGVTIEVDQTEIGGASVWYATWVFGFKHQTVIKPKRKEAVAMAKKMIDDGLDGKHKITMGRFLEPSELDVMFMDIASARIGAKRQAAKDDREAVAVWVGDELDRVYLRGYELEPVPF